jgi:hypothetical protein
MPITVKGGSIKKEAAGKAPKGRKKKEATAKETQRHALVQIEEITFSDHHVIDKDTLGPFTAPEWVRGKEKSALAPICYTRNKKVTLRCKFKVVGAPSATETVKVLGTSKLGTTELKWEAKVTVNPGDMDKLLETGDASSNSSLPNQIACYDSWKITWKAQPPGEDWQSAGTSKHLLYLLLNDPSGTPVYWTLADISCRSAHTKTTAKDLVASAFKYFRRRSIKRMRDGTGLTYWNPTSTTATNTRELLGRPDGSGQCGSWSEFLIDAYKLHGVLDGEKVLVVRDLTSWQAGMEGFLVKNWEFVGSGSLPVPYTHKMGSECQDRPGIPGQGNPDPPPAFYNHFIVRCFGAFYDPSYGVGPVRDQHAWEKGGIAGLYRDAQSDCSQGYLKEYTLLPGETLDSIAKRHGAIGKHLFHHRYNEDLRKKRGRPQDVAPGDVVYIVGTNILEFWSLTTQTKIT